MRRSSRSEAISSSTGATTRQGPHQAAQKSTSTGLSDSSTSAWKLLSVTSGRLPAMWFSGGSWVRGGYVLPVTIQSGVTRSRPRYGGVSAEGGRGPQEVRPDVDLDEGGEHEHGSGERGGRDRRGEELVETAPAAGAEPCGERQEQRGQLGKRVRQQREDQRRAADLELGREGRGVAAEDVRLGGEREHGGARDERDGERTGDCVDPARQPPMAVELLRELAAGDVPRHAREGVQRQHERV